MRVAIVTEDVVGRRMAGPGIRAWHFARELSKRFEVVLVARLRELDRSTAFDAVEWGTPAARSAMRSAAVVVGQPHRELLAVRHPRAIYDLFDPVVLELDEMIRRRPAMRLRVHRSLQWGRLAVALRQGWRLIAGAPRQLDFYLGVHAARVGDLSSWLGKWIEVPFGAERAPAIPPAVPAGPPVVVWGGGTWEWLDPQLAVDAVDRLNAVGVPARLLFLGGRHPNHSIAGATLASGPRRDWLLRNDQWVPYDERGAWLSCCRASVILHRRTAEAEMSLRTRVFDAIAYGIPVVASRGGWAADLVEQERIGVVVEPESLVSVAGALRRLIEDDAFHASCVSNLENLRPRFAWAVVVRPLAEAIERVNE
ncbi:MAG TPA: glycosyltransferase [Thermoanaerobaculia bacterium]|nr:glycosyltransferase [Thermoanaerobaculia bacterium]